MQQDLLDAFLDKGLISQDQSMVIKAEQRRLPRLLSQILLDLNLLSPSVIFETISQRMGVSLIDLSTLPTSQLDFNILGHPFCLEHQVLVFEPMKDHKHFSLAMADPEDIVSFDKVRTIFREQLGFEPKITRFLTDPVHIEKIIHQHCGTNHPLQSSHSTIEIVEQILRDSVLEQASDIHLIPENQALIVKLRLDGELHSYRILHSSYQSKIITRLKIMAGIDIAESRRPQSGRFEQKISGFQVDFRLSTHPTIYGEQVVIRLLNKGRKLFKLNEIGFNEEQVRHLLDMIQRPYGLILLSGPTGSGKTTTLYTLLQELDHQKRHVISLEEPVEYRIHGVRQTEIVPNGALNFAHGVRSLLRQDPDVIMIGEIRDEETAQMALRAAMTGHLVLSTVHAQDAFGIPMRLIDLGLTPAQLSGQILGLVGQRLIKVFCRDCQGNGCIACTHKRFRGRTVIAEVVTCNADLNAMIQNNPSRGEMLQFSKQYHLKTMREHALEKVDDGLTTADEVKRVLGEF